MASNKTTKLGLSQWLATDAILRSDFNSDNKKIDAALSNVPRIVSGTYRGTGLVGAENPKTLTFTFKPILVIITADSGSDKIPGSVFIAGQAQSDGLGNNDNPAYGLELQLTWGDDRISWYSTSGDAEKSLNYNGQLYHYFALGL